MGITIECYDIAPGLTNTYRPRSNVTILYQNNNDEIEGPRPEGQVYAKFSRLNSGIDPGPFSVNDPLLSPAERHFVWYRRKFWRMDNRLRWAFKTAVTAGLSTQWLELAPPQPMAPLAYASSVAGIELTFASRCREGCDFPMPEMDTN